METTEFYNQLASFYHLVYADWEASLKQQAEQLDGIIREHWGTGPKTLLDVSCGIGTQAIGLAQRGYQVTASDISAKAVERARLEAKKHQVALECSVSDMREAYHHYRRQFDIVISCDNSITHLLSEHDILLALRQMYRCVRPGGGCVLSVRDYDREARGRGLVKLYGTREVSGVRYLIFQVWDFDQDLYHLALYLVEDDGCSEFPKTRVMRSKYYALGTPKLLTLLKQAGFIDVKRLDGEFFQPILIGSKR